MLLEELFIKVVARHHPIQCDQPEKGEIILRRLRDLGDHAQSGNDVAAGSEESGIQDTSSSGLETK